METGKPQSSPFMETAGNQIKTLKLPEAADLLNQLKVIRRKSTASLADVEAILEMIGG